MIKFDNITTTVTNNKTAADRALANLTLNLDSEVSARKSLEKTYYATWVYQNDHLLSLMAAEFNSDGKIKGYADLQVRVNNIGSTVTDNKDAADRALKNLGDSLNDLWNYAGDIDDEQGASATWINQNKNKWQAVAASFNENGSVKALGSVGLFVNDKLSTFAVDADRINFKTGNFRITNKSGQTTLALDADGNLTVSGNFYGGNITRSVTVGTAGNKMEIYCDETVIGDLKASGIRGLGTDGKTVLNLGFTEMSGSSSPHLALKGKQAFTQNEVQILIRPDQIAFLPIVGNKPPITFGYALGSDKLYLSTWIECWPSRDEVGVGQVFLGDDEVLRVRRS